MLKNMREAETLEIFKILIWDFLRPYFGHPINEPYCLLIFGHPISKPYCLLIFGIKKLNFLTYLQKTKFVTAVVGAILNGM